MVEILLSNGADFNIQDNKKGDTPLHIGDFLLNNKYTIM